MKKKFITAGRITAKVLLWIAAGILLLWCIAAMFFFAPWSITAQKVAAILLVLVALGVTIFYRRWWTIGAVALLSFIMVRGVYALYPPSNDRVWLPENERAAIVRFEGDIAHIDNLRRMYYDENDERHIEWYSRSYNMREVDHIDYLVEPFSDFDGVAHTLISFGFSNGEHLAISGEIRREADESFTFQKAFFRHYELFFAVGDERDHIGLRTNRGDNPVYLIPIKTTKENSYQVLKAMLEMLTRVATEPEYYNAVTNSCTSNIICHIEPNTGINIPDLDSRRLIPEYSWEIAYEVGIIDLDCPQDQVLEQCRINDRAAFLPETVDDPRGINWSRKIRGLPNLDTSE